MYVWRSIKMTTSQKLSRLDHSDLARQLLLSSWLFLLGVGLAAYSTVSDRLQDRTHIQAQKATETAPIVSPETRQRQKRDEQQMIQYVQRWDGWKRERNRWKDTNQIIE